MKVDGLIETASPPAVPQIESSRQEWDYGDFEGLTMSEIGLPASAGQHFLLDTLTLNTLTYYHGIPAIKRWNTPIGASAADGLEDA